MRSETRIAAGEYLAYLRESMMRRKCSVQYSTNPEMHAQSGPKHMSVKVLRNDIPLVTLGYSSAPSLVHWPMMLGSINFRESSKIQCEALVLKVFIIFR
jgi:hypothetical protein